MNFCITIFNEIFVEISICADRNNNIIKKISEKTPEIFDFVCDEISSKLVIEDMIIN